MLALLVFTGIAFAIGAGAASYHLLNGQVQFGPKKNNNIYGTDSDDVLYPSRLDYGDGPYHGIYGGTGDDVIMSRQVKITDIVDGGAGNDKIWSPRFSARDDNWAQIELHGGIGDDTFYSTHAGDKIFGGDGNDTIYMAPISIISDSIHIQNINGGGGHKDTLDLSNQVYLPLFRNISILMSNDGDGDVLFAGETIAKFTGIEIFRMSDYDDRFDANGASNAFEVRGGWGKDTIIGGVGNDKIYGEQGNDTLLGGLGSDLIYGGTGDDRIYGGGNTYNTLDGGAGHDTIFGGQGTDYIFGGAGNDFLSAVDALVNNAFRTDASYNYLGGGEGHDTLLGSNAHSNLFGGSGNDKIYGGNGSEWISGGSGNDVIHAGSGTHYRLPNRIDGGAGSDRMWAGRDADTFIFRQGDGADVIHQFNWLRDKVEFRGTGERFSDLRIMDTEDGAVITYGDNPEDEITFRGVSASHLIEDVFVFDFV